MIADIASTTVGIAVGIVVAGSAVAEGGIAVDVAVGGNAVDVGVSVAGRGVNVGVSVATGVAVGARYEAETSRKIAHQLSATILWTTPTTRIPRAEIDGPTKVYVPDADGP